MNAKRWFFPGLLAAALMGGLLSLGCSGDDDSPSVAAPTTAPTEAPPLSVITLDNSFSPASLAARSGQVVTINVRNDGQRPHTFTIDGVVDSGRLAAGESKTVEFTPTAGSLTFYCMVHGAAQMSGSLSVSGSGAALPPSSSSPSPGSSETY